MTSYWERFGLTAVYKMSATAYKTKHDPTYLGGNIFGSYYEHPIFGDEGAMLVIPHHEDRIYKTFWEDIPDDIEIGATIERIV